MEKGRINLIDKSNIYGEPAVNLNINMIEDSPVTAGSARNQRRLEKKNPPTFKEHEIKRAEITAVFDKPIANNTFHVHIVSIGGPSPVRLGSNINNRVGSIILDEIANECAFRIWFNKVK